MTQSTISRLCVTLLGALALTGCGAAKPKAATAGDYDRPVPAAEPRQDIGLVVDLKPASDCEERFDLAIYAHRGVELVAWDDKAGACADRHVNIRYLTGKLDEEGLLSLVREHAEKVKKTTK